MWKYQATKFDLTQCKWRYLKVINSIQFKWANITSLWRLSESLNQDKWFCCVGLVTCFSRPSPCMKCDARKDLHPHRLHILRCIPILAMDEVIVHLKPLGPSHSIVRDVIVQAHSWIGKVSEPALKGKKTCGSKRVVRGSVFVCVHACVCVGVSVCSREYSKETQVLGRKSCWE